MFIVSAISPMVIGFKSDAVNNIQTSDEDILTENYNCYNVSEISISEYHFSFNESIDNVDIESEETINLITTTQPLDAPMNSSWPMYCHDTRHTGHSPYNTSDTWDEIWTFETWGTAWGGPAIDGNGTIYIGAYPLHAVYPNGTLKWTLDTGGYFTSTTPAIDEDGTIYIGSRGWESDFYAINSDGTLKWIYPTSDVYSSPAIGLDGTIYFGCENDNIYALNPNGTLRWKYSTDHVVYSSPAIGFDGTIYCGSHDTYLYALFPNNGTLKWKYKTGNWIRTSPCIADDGTIYVVSLDNHLYAIYPNGTLKWKTDMGEAGTSPTIGWDGTIYAGYKSLHAFNPTNGSLKWKFKVSGTMRGGTPCNSIDGTIYLGTHIGSYDDGEIFAIYPNGSLKFRKRIRTVESAPAIGSDGTVYIGSHGGDIKGYLHAFGRGELNADADGPYYGLINEPVQFNGTATGGYPPYNWQWDFGDGNTSDEKNPAHAYTFPGNFTATLTATDDTGNTSDDTTWAWIQESNNPPNKPSIDGETNGSIENKYDYNFLTLDPEGLKVWYYIEWGDSTNTGWIGPYISGKNITKSHSWSKKDTYIIRCKAKDPYGDESEWGTLEVTMPKNQQVSNMWLLRWLDRFPLLERLLSFPIFNRLLIHLGQ